MLVSMTGFGESVQHADGISAHVEIRTVNNRHFKLNCRLPDGYSSLEPKVDSLLRKHIRRGTVNFNLKVNLDATDDAQWLHESVLMAYFRQLQQLGRNLGADANVRLDHLLMLPGVINEAADVPTDLGGAWPVIESVIVDAVSNLSQMRQDEGGAMAVDLAANRSEIGEVLEHIAIRAPMVVANYQSRLRDRLNQLLEDYDVEVQASDVVREVGVFADRADISEEIVRLRSHLEQFDEILEAAESNGKKLEFVIQEMFRETNTIGSKANDAQISRHVVDIKTIIERLREMAQNIE